MGFSPGQIVCLASNPSIRGVVVEVQAGPSEDRIMVFVDGNVQRYYASQLQAVDQSDSVSPYSAAQFQTYLTALQIRHPSLSTLYSLNAARVDFIPLPVPASVEIHPVGPSAPVDSRRRGGRQNHRSWPDSAGVASAAGDQVHSHHLSASPGDRAQVGTGDETL